jgi:hypothetical protein
MVTTVRAKLAILLAARPPLVNAPPQTDNVWDVDCSSFFADVGNAAIHGAYFATDATINLMRKILKGIHRGVLERTDATKGNAWP